MPPVDAALLRENFTIEPAECDPKQLFYRMGYAAAQAESQVSITRSSEQKRGGRWLSVSLGVAASLVAFFLGSMTRPQTDSRLVAEQETIVEPIQVDQPKEERLAEEDGAEASQIMVASAPVEPEQGTLQGGVLANLEFVSNIVPNRGFTLSTSGIRMRSPLTDNRSSEESMNAVLQSDFTEFEI